MDEKAIVGPMALPERQKTILCDLLKEYKNKISVLRALMRLPNSSIRDIAMNAILNEFRK